MEAISKVRIFSHVTTDRMFDVWDGLTVETARSRVVLSLSEFDQKREIRQLVRVAVPVAELKLVCYDILNQLFSEWAITRGTQGAETTATVATIRKDVKYRQPYVVKMDHGIGEMLPGNTVKMVRADTSLTVLMRESDTRQMAQTVLDYIRDWETVNFRKRQEAQTFIHRTTESAE